MNLWFRVSFTFSWNIFLFFTIDFTFVEQIISEQLLSSCTKFVRLWIHFHVEWILILIDVLLVFDFFIFVMQFNQSIFAQTNPISIDLKLHFVNLAWSNREWKKERKMLSKRSSSKYLRVFRQNRLDCRTVNRILFISLHPCITYYASNGKIVSHNNIDNVAWVRPPDTKHLNFPALRIGSSLFYVIIWGTEEWFDIKSNDFSSVLGLRNIYIYTFSFADLFIRLLVTPSTFIQIYYSVNTT